MSSPCITPSIIAVDQLEQKCEHSSPKKIKLDPESESIDNSTNHNNNSNNENEIKTETLINSQEEVKKENTEIVKKYVNKKKYALLIGYCGEGYYGLQRNPSIKDNKFRTIEDEIVDSLVKINSIPQEHADEMYKMSFQRAARTDKGVSAAENLISLKMVLNEDTLENLNKNLPKQIRVFGFTRVTKSFDAKNNCDGRTYIYILPTYAFCPLEENLTENYRITEDVLDKVNETFRILCGTHNFHNFTSGRKYTDPSAKRYILSFECSKPFLKDGQEFAVIKVRGQSFMLHQIRKMVGLVIAVMRGFANKETIDLCWTANKIDVPTAPALGLMLDKLHYDKYNKKFGKDGEHESLEWNAYEKEIEEFKHEYIFSNIIKKEITKKSMFTWLSRLPISHHGILDPRYVRGYYTGIGRAMYKLELLNKTNSQAKEEEEESSDANDE